MGTAATYDDVLARVRHLVSSSERVPVVGISGHGGAGKSTMARALAADLGLEPGQVVSTDSFYATTCGPTAGLWEQHDWALLEALLTEVRGGAERLRFDYRWWTGETGVRDHPMPPVVLVEGIRLLGEHTWGWFDLSVWLDVDPGTAGARAKARNVLQGDDRAELELWDTKWIPEGHAYAAEVRPDEVADLVVPAH